MQAEGSIPTSRMPVWAFLMDNNVFTFKDNPYFTPNVFIEGVLIVI
jgi:hypothetical protein